MTERAVDPARQAFEAIATELMREHAEVAPGKMMSSPGITLRGKVFAFFDRGEMVFRLGKGVDPASLGITSYRPLSPFKNKPPLAGWFYVAAAERQYWERLARTALERLAAELHES